MEQMLTGLCLWRGQEPRGDPIQAVEKNHLVAGHRPSRRPDGMGLEVAGHDQTETTEGRARK